MAAGLSLCAAQGVLVQRAHAQSGLQGQVQGQVQAQVRAQVQTLGERASAAAEAGDFLNARIWAEKAAADAQALSPDDPARLQALHDLGAILAGGPIQLPGDAPGGELGRAEGLLRDVLARRRSSLGPGADETIDTATALAQLLQSTGRYADAEPIYREVLAARRRQGAARPETFTALNNLASLLQASGRLEAAEPLYREALAGFSSTVGPLDARTLGARNNLGGLLEATGRGSEALQQYAQALDGFRRTVGDNDPRTLTTVANIANFLVNSGSAAQAEPYLRMLTLRLAAVFGPQHPHTQTNRYNLARALLLQGRFGEAITELGFVRSGFEAAFGKRHPYTISTVNFIAYAMKESGRVEEAAALLESAGGDSLAWAAAQIAETEGADQRRRIAGDQVNSQAAAFGVALAGGGPVAARLAAETVLAWKQIDGAEEAATARFVAESADPAVVEAATRIQAARAGLAAALQRNGADVDERLDALEAARSALAEVSRDFAAQLREQRADLAEVRAALPQGAALLEYRSFVPVDLTATAPPARRLIAVMIRKSGDPVVKDLGPLEPIAEDVFRLLDFEATGRRDAAERLADRLLRPFERELAATGTLYLSPDGPLHLTPFDLLPFGAGRYWIESQDVRIVSTGRVLTRERGAGAARGLLAIGGPDYDDRGGAGPARSPGGPPSALERQARASTRAGGFQGFDPLPETGPEVETIAAEMRAASGEPAEILLGAAAREAALKRLTAAPRALHLATHGFFLDDDERASVSPMALSGLALAGANAGLSGEADADGEDGVLWALEAMSLPLRGTELVTLSACDTARGVVDASEGVYGLGRAFQIAGADNVLITLWPLFDENARAFMEEFYRAWLAGGSADPAVALRQTKLAWARSSDPERADPEVWAPYVLSQNGR